MSTPWVCGACGGATTDETALRDHREWCLGDAAANVRLLDDVANQTGELAHEELVAAAEHYRLAAQEWERAD
jgi:hypothetical protein